MDAAGTEKQTNSLTPSQREAVAARGNVLVMAGAGTGKTHTLVERCLDLVCNDRVSLDEMLIVTFTEAAAAEVRERLREGLEEAAGKRPADTHLPEQLALFDAAHIGTLHSFCFKLVREHFHALELDPQLTVLDEAQSRLLADEILEEQFQSHYEYSPADVAGKSQAGHQLPASDESASTLQHFNASTALSSLAVQDLISVYGNGRDDTIRALVLRLHHYIQTRADADTWLAKQIEAFSSADPAQWREWLLKAVQDWHDEWLPILKNLRGENVKAAECLEILEEPGTSRLTGDAATALFEKIAAADTTENYPYREKTVLRKPLEDFFEDAEFLASLMPIPNAKGSQAEVQLPTAPTADPSSPPVLASLARAGKKRKSAIHDSQSQLELFRSEEPPPIPPSAEPAASGNPHSAIHIPQLNTPLVEDWQWSRGHMKTLLLLAKEFAEKYSARKRADGVVDFHDLEQFAIKLLAGTSQRDVPTTEIASQWRDKLRFIFVDEYQDINAAQDKIISALSADNRFLVGDVKQSIYRFRLADPTIFRDYAKDPVDWKARVIPLTENFRSREGLLDFVNSVFTPLMTENLGGVPYDEQAKLKFGSPDTRAELSVAQNPGPRVEMLLREKKRGDNGGALFGEDPLADLQESELEALMVASRLRELKESGHLISDDGKLRAAEWRDFAVLLRSPGSKAEVYAKQFANAGVPLQVERGGFYDSAEILDLLSLLQLADNPLQDVPCIAVLRSPLVGCSLDELAEIRLAARAHFWFALNSAVAPGSGLKEGTREKIGKFLQRFSNWRKLARQTSLSGCLDAILSDTHYDDWLLSRPRGVQRRANVQRFLHLAEQFDAFQRQGLFRFLKFVDAQREIEAEPDVAPLAEENAVRLMSIHQSKGLEFPVVVLADLGKAFNEQDLRGEIILDEQFGLCPRIKPPSSGGRYPSLAYWLARKNQRRELRGEELRLLYVALTRARDMLILSGGISAKKWETRFAENTTPGPRDIVAANSCMDWLGMWFAIQGLNFTVEAGAHGESPLLRWRVVGDSKLKEETAAGPPAQPNESSGLQERLSSDKLTEILNWQYPFSAATRQAAKTSVSALRREAADDEAEQPFRRPIRRAQTAIEPASGRQRTPARLNAADTGVAHHKFLQHFAFETVAGVKSFAAEVKRLEKEHYLSADEAAALDLEALADFWMSEMGKAIRANASHVRREMAFTAGFAPAELGEIFRKEQGTGLDGETIVVQGVADLVVVLPKEIWLVDFKTDGVTAKELSEKTEFYSTQLKLYARALEKIYCRPVTDCRLHFLAVRKTVKIRN